MGTDLIGKGFYHSLLCIVAAGCLMILRDLGKTGLRVGEIGLGTEHLGRTSKARELIVKVVDRAVDRGVNYFDLIFNFKEYVENYGVAFKDHRDKLVLACHLGSAERNGQYFKTRSIGMIEKVFSRHSFKAQNRLH